MKTIQFRNSSRDGLFGGFALIELPVMIAITKPNGIAGPDYDYIYDGYRFPTWAPWPRTVAAEVTRRNWRRSRRGNEAELVS